MWKTKSRKSEIKTFQTAKNIFTSSSPPCQRIKGTSNRWMQLKNRFHNEISRFSNVSLALLFVDDYGSFMCLYITEYVLNTLCTTTLYRTTFQEKNSITNTAESRPHNKRLWKFCVYGFSCFIVTFLLGGKSWTLQAGKVFYCAKYVCKHLFCLSFYSHLGSWWINVEVIKCWNLFIFNLAFYFQENCDCYRKVIVKWGLITFLA